MTPTARFPAFLGAALLLCGCGARHIETIGTATVPAPTDRIVCTVSIHQTGKTPGEAFHAAEKTGKEVLTAAGNLLPTGTVSSERIVVRSADPAAANATGYVASLSIAVVVDELSKRVDVLDALAAISGVRIESTDVTLQSPQKAYDKAREAALTDAREKADSVATKLGLKIGQVAEVDELPPEPSAPSTPAPPRDYVPLGALPVEARVRVVYDVK